MDVSPVVETRELFPEQLATTPTRRFSGDSALRRLLALGDAFAVLVALVAALVIPPVPAGGHPFLWGLFAVPLMLFLFKLYGLYDRDVKRISHSTVDDVPYVFHATVIGGLILWFYSRYSPFRRLNFLEMLQFGCAVLLLVLVVRSVVRRAAGRVIGRERALLVGGGDMAWTLVGKLGAHPEYRLDVIGSLSAPGASSPDGDTGLPALGTLEDLEQVAQDRGVARVVLSARDVGEAELEPTLRRCRALSLKVSVLPTLADVLGPGVAIDDVEGVTVLGLNPPWLPRSSRALKRMMDLMIAVPLLIIASPLLLAIAIAIKLDSRGPVLFAQERVGKGGKHLPVLKFRTMVADAEQRRAELLAHSTDPNWLMVDRDPRITRVGRRLRRLSLDELPQLWNVVRGEMSMVGPRPLIPIEDELVTSWARGRLDLTPGITGYWQVLGRTRIPFEEMIKLDYLYVMNWSLWEDVRLMLRTLPVVLGGRGAN
jgi:exopolysaccharide biosynthesis polyprenyl glycosylphosphotransferase